MGEGTRSGLDGRRRRGFYPMAGGDLLFIVALMGFALVGFLPWARTTRWAGMAALGWLMAALMVASPLVALVRLWLGRSDSGELKRSERSVDGQEPPR